MFCGLLVTREDGATKKGKRQTADRKMGSRVNEKRNLSTREITFYRDDKLLLCLTVVRS